MNAWQSSEAAMDAVIALLRGAYSRWRRDTPVEHMRRDLDELFGAHARPWPIVEVDANGVPAEWIAAPDMRWGRTILYLHGGGFRTGSINSHRDLIQRLSIAAEARILAIDYRLSPEHPFPAAVDDALAAYRWLIGQGLPAATIAVAGDSAGGGLALSLLLAARAGCLPLPGAVHLMSPWTDLTASGASYATRAERDPINQRAMVLGLAKGYLGSHGDARDPLASPLLGDLGGLPPLLVQCGGREIILDDSVVLVERAKAAGVEATLDLFEDMIHVFQMFDELPDAAIALKRAGAFLQAHVRAPST